MLIYYKDNCRMNKAKHEMSMVSGGQLSHGNITYAVMIYFILYGVKLSLALHPWTVVA